VQKYNNTAQNEIDDQARINRLIAEQASMLTQARRFGGSGAISFRDILQTVKTCTLDKFLTTSVGNLEPKETLYQQADACFEMDS